MPELLESIINHELFPLGIVIVVFILAMIAYSKGTKKDRFEKKLATSKINSMSVGLVEIVGHVRAIKQCDIPVFKKTCVGYSYIIERIRHDSERNRNTYHVKYTENHIESFYLEDDTGKVLVEPEGIMADSLPEDFNYRHDTNYRHRCSYLKDNEKVMIIGRAQPRDGKLILVRDEQTKLFHLTPYSAVVHDRAKAPLMSRAFVYCLLAAVVSALIIYL